MKFSIIILGLIYNAFSIDARYSPVKGSSRKTQQNDTNEFRLLGVGTVNDIYEAKAPKDPLATKEPKSAKDMGEGKEDALSGGSQDEDGPNNESLLTLSPAISPMQTPTTAPVISPTLKPSLDQDEDPALHTPIILYPETPTAPSLSPVVPTIIIINPAPTPTAPTPGTQTTRPVSDPNKPSVSWPSPSEPMMPTKNPSTNPDPPSAPTPSAPIPGTTTTKPVSDPNQPSVSRPSSSESVMPFTSTTKAPSAKISDMPSSSPSVVPSSSPTLMLSAAIIARSLLPFGVTLEGESEQFVDVEEPLTLSLEFFLEQKLGEVFEGVTSVRLQEDDGLQSIQRQAVQKTFRFEGNANFQNDNAPSTREVHRAQLDILENFLFELGGILQDNEIALDPTSVIIDQDNINTADDDVALPGVGTDDSNKEVLDDSNDINSANGDRGVGRDDDEDNDAIWIGLAAAGLVLAIGLFVVKRRRPNDIHEELSLNDEENSMVDTSEPKPLSWDGVFKWSSLGFEELEGNVSRPQTEFMNVPNLEKREVVTLKRFSDVSPIQSSPVMDDTDYEPDDSRLPRPTTLF